MRGTRDTPECGIAGTGIIPAYAGNTCQIGVNWPSVRDHPRVCGEHFELLAETGDKLGSSPRMRGTHPTLPVRDNKAGIIPAYAGNTMVSALSSMLIRDHPRVCGEHTKRL